MDRVAAAEVIRVLLYVGVIAQTPSPTPTRRVIDPPPADPFVTIAAIVAIVLALAAGVIAYRVIRGGRGL